MKPSNDVLFLWRGLLFGAAVSLLLLPGCASPLKSQASEAPRGVQVHVLLYSGRPDPTFVIEDTAGLAELRNALTAAKENLGFKGTTVIPARLGYKGFMLRNPHREGDLPAHIAVYRGDIEVLDQGKRFLTDDGALEQWLVKRATESKKISEREIEQIRKR